MIDLQSSISRYFPSAPLSVAFTAASTAFQLVNSSAFDRIYGFVASQDCYVKYGPSDIAAADTTDWPLAAGQPHFFAVKAGYGVRAIRASADGVLKIANTGT